MMIIALVFEQMFWHFEGAIGFLCKRESRSDETDAKRMASLAHNSLMTFGFNPALQS